MLIKQDGGPEHDDIIPTYKNPRSALMGKKIQIKLNFQKPKIRLIAESDLSLSPVL